MKVVLKFVQGIEATVTSVVPVPYGVMAPFVPNVRVTAEPDVVVAVKLDRVMR